MARAKNTIEVDIIGDASDLKKASKESRTALGGISRMAKVAGAALVAGFAVDKVLDFTQTALAESDRINDATDQLKTSLGSLSEPLLESAQGMERLGQSRQDVLELEARFVNLAKAAHLSNQEIAASAQPATEAAAALALMGIGGGDASTVLDLIGKAAGGASKPLKELGVDLTKGEVEARALKDTGKENAKALTEQELAAARFALIMEKLAPRITAVTDGSADLEQTQSELQARFETITGKIGQAVEGPLNDFLGWVITGIDGLGRLGELIDVVGDNFAAALTPIARFADSLRTVLGLIDDTLKGLGLINANARIAPNGGRIVGSPSNVTVTVQGGSPEVVQRSVQQAIVRLYGSGPP